MSNAQEIGHDTAIIKPLQKEGSEGHRRRLDRPVRAAGALFHLSATCCDTFPRAIGDTLTFADGGDGTLKYSDSDQSYSFKPDGGTFTTPLGQERTFKQNDERTYTSTTKNHGLLLRTTTWKLAADGNTLMVVSKGTKPNGDAFEISEKYVRTSPGTGLVGGWKGKVVKLSSPNALTFHTSGDEVSIDISAIQATWRGKWDGKDYPASGPTAPDGLTVALTRTGPNSFRLVQKVKGKILDIVRFRIGSDGKTMIARGTDGEGKEPYTEVYEKQG